MYLEDFVPARVDICLIIVRVQVPNISVKKSECNKYRGMGIFSVLLQIPILFAFPLLHACLLADTKPGLIRVHLAPLNIKFTLK